MVVDRCVCQLFGLRPKIIWGEIRKFPIYFQVGSVETRVINELAQQLSACTLCARVEFVAVGSEHDVDVVLVGERPKQLDQSPDQIAFTFSSAALAGTNHV